ncbi:hypothetical protein ACFORL_05605 [Legionella dresdenensis]|uniref:Uncharacterized protein n=1 Tax=Legionella dresdenensis TaxID=450200 RepID=A0ABV8CE86_9GAMM
MATADSGTVEKQYRYEVIAQKFKLPHGLCVLSIRDKKDDIIIHTAAALVFRDDEMLADMSPQDIRKVGYIFACDFETIGKNPDNIKFINTSCSHSDNACM